MSRMRLKDIAIEKNERVDNPSQSQYSIFVGLEHYDSGEATIRRHGSTERLESTMKVFHSGDILIARRNVYLKRAATVDFDGLTSGDSIVLHIENEAYWRIAPFVLNTDDFWIYANQHADGSMSKRLSPKLLMEYEFSLPDGNLEQVADILWAMERVKTAYRELIARTDDLVKSQFIEMFGDPVENPMRWGKKPLSKSCQLLTGNTPSRKVPEYYGKYIEWIKSDNISTSSVFLSTAAERLSESGAAVGRVVEPGSILMTCIAGSLNTIGNVAIVDRQVAFNQQINALIPKEYETMVLYYLLQLIRPQLHEAANSALKCILNKGTLGSIQAIVPDTALQKRFASIAEQSDKSKFAGVNRNLSRCSDCPLKTAMGMRLGS